MLNFYTKDNIFHHAYCIVGNTAEVLSELELFLKKEFNFITSGNPDFWYGEYDVLDVDDARKLKDLHQNKPIAGDKKIFVLSTNFITEKAQNAMLKLFEEPRGDTHFFLVMPQSYNLIPTLKSRLLVVPYFGKATSLINAKEYIGMSVGVRLETVKKLMESITDEEKSKIEVIKFLNSLETELSNKINKKSIESVKILEELARIRQYSEMQSPSLKMLLEHLSITLPVLKN